MQFILYNTIFPLAASAAKALSLFSPKLKTFFRVRKNLFLNLEKARDSGKKTAPVVWVHAASAGEFEQARPIIEELKTSRPDLLIRLSFQSVSAYTIHKDYPGADMVFYHPLDTARNARRTVDIVRPDVFVLMRYDFWPNHLRAAKERGARLVLAAAVLRDRSVYFKPVAKWFYGRIFSLFHSVFTVSECDRRRFATTFGRTDAVQAGDPRFDQALRRKHGGDQVARLAPFYAARTLLVAGSTWEKDEDLLLAAYRKLHASFPLVLVPHDVSEANIERLEGSLRSAGIPWAKLSCLPEEFTASSVLIVDRIGILVELYALAKIAYVGGGFGVNVHNTVEPAVHGIPVLFGPVHLNSPEAGELIVAGGAIEVRGADDLAACLRNLLDDPAALRHRGEAAGAYVAGRLGASRRIAAGILRQIDGLS
ncbi:3-deoxy-D-manno-octulosonic acid transferase [Prosthecochloris sp. GSB1]|uniref:3-deoxy-D-manno-octulosonic acid transferase n=1 Tax=Prosthecochloris sp. GSB1 TaxID=281093 RepID=UPI001F40D12F|nr:glycosyltransferase N-terminal domain-containing protein [Prosthecochloris sp. GSB1]